MIITTPYEIPADAIGLPTRGATVDFVEEAANDKCRFLRVRGAVHPVDRASWDIHFQVNLPEHWNGKMLHIGGGGFDGFLVTGEEPCKWQPADHPTPLGAGYATFGSDSGHIGGLWDSRFALNDEALRNFAHEHILKTRDAVLHIVRHYYDKAPERIYFTGSSNGGRAALKAVIHYPEAYDGVICLYPVLNWTAKAVKDAMNATMLMKNEWEGWIGPDDMRRVSDKITELCDPLDGAADGLISNLEGALSIAEKVRRAVRPLLSVAQWNALAEFAEPLEFGYPLAGGVTSMPGYMIFQGEPIMDLTMSQMGDKGVRNGFMAQFADSVVRYQIMRDGEFDTARLDIEKHSEQIRKASALLDATDAEIGPFLEGGGKLLLMHGMMDPMVTPAGTIDYYNRVKALYGDRIEESIRFYLIPGYGHGEGEKLTMSADLLGILDDWVVNGIAPEVLVVGDKRPDAGEVTRLEVLYPAYPRYKGSGSMNDAGSFEAAYGAFTEM